MIDQKLKTFYELSRLKNMTKTARYMNMTQPGVSKQIKQLEKHYGVKLIEKNGRKLEITRAGEILKEETEKLIIIEKNIHQKLETFTKPIKNQYMGATKTIGAFLAPELMENYSRFKNDRLLLRVDNTKNILEKLDSGDIDLALVEGLFENQKYNYKIIKSDELICVTSQKDFKNRMTLDDIKQKILILREQGSGTRAIIENALGCEEIRVNDFKATMEIGDWSAIKSLVSRSMGISFLSKIAAEEEIKMGLLCEQKIEEFALKRNFYYVWRKNDTNEFVKDFLMYNQKLYKDN